MNELINQILAPTVLGLAAALVKSFIDIQGLKDKVQRLNDDRIAHEKHNEEQYTRIYDKLDIIYQILAKKDK